MESRDAPKYRDQVVKYFHSQNEPFYLFDDQLALENIAKLIFLVAVHHGSCIVELDLWETSNRIAVWAA